MVKKALLIGINYKGTSDELRGCINDVKNIQSILINNCDYLNENIRMLTEEHEFKPTRENIENNIKWLISNCMAGDTLIFYYSGHGYYANDENGDEIDKKDEVLIPLDYDTKGVITDDWLYQNMVVKVPKNVKLWGFADCCHSGTMLDLRCNFKSLCKYKKGKVEKGMSYNHIDWTNSFVFNMEKSKNIEGTVCMFSGSLDPQVAADAFLSETFQGAFTYCLIECIKTNLERMSDGRFRFKNGAIKLRNLLKEINARLDIHDFKGQDSQLSIARTNDLEMTFDL
jgi:hypothetical protein